MNILDFLFKKHLAPKIIEVDDSGSGSLYGGMIILVTDGINDYYKEVPLKLFAITRKTKRMSEIKKNISKIIKAGVKKLHGNKKETIIRICRGNYFDQSSDQLKKEGYNIKRIEIEGRTNARAEYLFKLLLNEKYGIKNYSPSDYKGENLRQYNILKKRRDFKNVKIHNKGIDQIKAQA